MRTRTSRLLQIARDDGLTLIEMAVAIVVLVVIAAIAVPSWRLYVVRTQREEARTALSRVQAAQEKSLIDQGRYSADLAALGLQAKSERDLYALDVALTRTGYVARASAAATSARDRDPHCAVFTLNEAGTRKAVDNGGADRTAECWR